MAALSFVPARPSVRPSVRISRRMNVAKNKAAVKTDLIMSL